MMRRPSLLVLASLIVALLITPLQINAAGKPPAQTQLVLQVTVNSPADVHELIDAGYDVLEARAGNVIFILGDDAVVQQLQSQGYNITAASPIQTSNSIIQSYFGGYRTVAEHEAHLVDVATAHPDLVKVVDYGDSWRKLNNVPNGHDLMAICITRMQAGDCALNPGTPKPRFLLMAAIHARELSTSEMAWRWIDLLVNDYGLDPDITMLLDTSEMWVIPVANPDGRHIVEAGGNTPYLHRKNANNAYGNCLTPAPGDQYGSWQAGVDLNRNASFKWGGNGTSSQPCHPLFRGPSAASEPEEQAIESLIGQLFLDQRGALITDTAPISTTGTFISLHSFSDLVLLPWGWTECSFGACPPSLRAPNDAGLRALAFRMSHFNGYLTGQPSEVLYAASGTTDDWAYGQLGIASYTYEIGPPAGEPCGFFTPPYSCQDGTFWPLNRNAFLYAAKTARQPYALSRGPSATDVTLSCPIVSSSAPATLTVTLDDTTLGVNGINRPTPLAITEAEVYVDAPPWAGGTPIAMTAADGAFDAAREDAHAMINGAGLSDGRHLIYVRGKNADGFWGPVTAQWLNVGTGSTCQTIYFPFAPR